LKLQKEKISSNINSTIRELTKVTENLKNYHLKSKKNKKFIILLIFIFGVLIYYLNTNIIFYNSKLCLNTYASSMVKYNSKNIAKTYHPNYKDFMIKSYKKDIEDIIDDTFIILKDKDYKVLSYKIIEKEKYNNKQLIKYAENLEKKYDIEEENVKKVIKYTIRYKIVNNGKKETSTVNVYTVKIKFRWYIFN